LATRQIAPTLADIQEARQRLQGIAERTPIYLSETFSRRSEREVRLKAENLQRTGAFKIRGAVNKLSTLSPEERAAGVVAASAGNHGQAVAWAALHGSSFRTPRRWRKSTHARTTEQRPR
jgi:threonine dehydratase